MKKKAEIIKRLELLTKTRQQYAEMVENHPDTASDIAPEIAVLTYQIETLWWVLGCEKH